MNKDITLVILAAGMGSRFGGLKQITPMGPNDEFIIDYSVYDAIRAGFNKIVFLIKEENYELFKETIGKRVEPHINVEYCFQDNRNLPEGYQVPEERVKPLGTAHALLCCKDKVNEPFAMINADDFYGKDAYEKAAEFLKSVNTKAPYSYGLVGYQAQNTLSKNGAAKRGICKIENGYLKEIIESEVEEINGKIMAKPLNGNPAVAIQGTDIVSMNMLLFTPSIFDYIAEKFPEFLDNNKNNIMKCEYLIPDVLFSAIKNNYATTKVLKTTATWYGVTYKEDTEEVKTAIESLVNAHEYPKYLWEE